MGKGGCPPAAPRAVPPRPPLPPAPQTRRGQGARTVVGSSTGHRGARERGERSCGGAGVEKGAGGCGGEQRAEWGARPHPHQSGRVETLVRRGVGSGRAVGADGGRGGGVGRSSIMSTESRGRGGQLTHRRGAGGGGGSSTGWPAAVTPRGVAAGPGPARMPHRTVVAIKLSGFGAAPARCGPAGTAGAGRPAGRRPPHVAWAYIGDRPRLACTGVGPRALERGSASRLRRAFSAAQEAGGGRRCLGRQYRTGGQSPAEGT